MQPILVGAPATAPKMTPYERARERARCEHAAKGHRQNAATRRDMANAATEQDAEPPEVHERMAAEHDRLALEYENKADALKDAQS